MVASGAVAPSVRALVFLFFFGAFGDRISYVVFADFAFMGLAGFAVFLLRARERVGAFPLLTRGYPFAPAVSCGMPAWFTARILRSGPEPLLYGLGLLPSLPVYELFRRRAASSSP